MKKIAILFCLFFLLSSCNNDWIPSGERDNIPTVNRIELTRAEQAVYARDLDFGISVFKDIAKIEGSDNNLLFCPFSASLAFSLLSAGANGKTRQQLIRGLGFQGLDYADMASYYKKMSSGMMTASENVTVSFANAVWAECPLKEDFVTEAKKSYNAEISYLSFGDAVNAAETINVWTGEKTCGMIKSIVSAQDIMGAVSVLENALYFNSKWTDKGFGTKDALFSTKDGKTGECKFFTNGIHSYMQSFFSDNVSILKIPYEDGVFNFIVALPPKGKNISNFIASLSGEQWHNWNMKCHGEPVYFEVPCFDSECTMTSSFEEAIKNRGIIIPFDSQRADFTNMTDWQIFVGKAIQKTAIKVSEVGTEASASTAIVMALGAALDQPVVEPKRFIADRPFVYAIEEASTGTLLFIGAHVK